MTRQESVKYFCVHEDLEDTKCPSLFQQRYYYSIFKLKALEAFGTLSTLKFAPLRQSSLKTTRSRRMLEGAGTTVETRSLVDASFLGMGRVTTKFNFSVQSDRVHYVVLAITS